MAGSGAGGVGSIHQYVLDGAMDYFRVVLHPRLQKDTCPIAADCLHPQTQRLVDLPAPLTLSNCTGFPPLTASTQDPLFALQMPVVCTGFAVHADSGKALTDSGLNWGGRPG